MTISKKKGRTALPESIETPASAPADVLEAARVAEAELDKRKRQAREAKKREEELLLYRFD